MGQIKLAVVGDVFLGRPLPRGRSGDLFAQMASADVTFVNLESPYSERGYPAEKYTFLRSPPELIAELNVMGVDVVTLANNHMLDYGYDALFDTLDLLDARNVKRCGAGRNLREAYAPAIVEADGIRIAFIGFSSTLPLGCAAGNERPGLAPIHIFSAFVLEPSPRTQEQPGTPPPVKTFPLQDDITRMQKEIAAAKEKADFVVVAGHWGLASRHELAEYQPAVGHALIDAGADVVIGHHSHTLQAIEIYSGKPIFYSVGNFIFHDLPGKGNPQLSYGGVMTPNLIKNRMPRETALFELHVEKKGLSQVSIVPAWINDDGNPMLATGDQSRRVLDLLDSVSRPFGTTIKRHADTGNISFTPVGVD